MTKVKNLVMIFVVGIVLLLIPSICNATDITVERNFYSNDGSMKFNFSGLSLDKTHEYEFGLTRITAETVGTWFVITDYTESTAIVDIKSNTKALREVVDATDTGYITIRDKTKNTVILQPYEVDLKVPFFLVTNYTVIPNGKEFSAGYSTGINVPLRNASNSKAYYQYEKITDENVISKYKEIKAKNGDIMELSDLLKTSAPKSNWSSWSFFNAYGIYSVGEGYPQKTISVPDSGLYYMWLYFSGNNIKSVYGYILVDNLQPDIELEGISLPKTEKVELGKTITLKPTFNPSNATNKIVTWSSSDESIATVDNGGKVTPKKLGSTIITVTSQDGKQKATCTLTVVATSNDTKNSQIQQTTGNGVSATGQDTTIATGSLPKAGLKIGLSISIILVTGVVIFAYLRYNKFRDIK